MRVLLLLAVVSALFTVPAAAFEPTEADFSAADRHMRSGYAYVRAKKYTAALREYRKGLDLLPGNMDLLYNLVAVAKAGGSCPDVLLYGNAFAGVAGRSKEMGEVRGLMDGCAKTVDSGRLELEGAPVRAEVWVSGVFMGKAPLKDLTLPAGDWPVRVTQEDHDDWFGTATVRSGEVAKVPVSLVARIYTGYLQVKTVPEEGVRVYVNEKLVGVTPMGPIALDTGKVLVRFELDGWDLWHRYVRIERDATEVLEATLERTEDQHASNDASR
ncbi:MAG: hypothetical protein AMXMBFR64_58870 [Myxococcales bacterium]